MSKLLDYIDNKGSFSFEESPFNVIDAALFSQLTLFKLDDIISEDGSKTLEEVFACYLKHHSFEETVGFFMTLAQNYIFKKMSEVTRYKNLSISDFVRIIDEKNICQFEALTVDLGDKILISFGGTDDTIVGWHEDFLLIYKDKIEGHRYAKEYIEKISTKFNKDILICGHSKGANLALETLFNVDEEIYNKISFVYCFDGPGINGKLHDETCVKNRVNKVISYLPFHSFIGKLFEHYENIKIVDSKANFSYHHDIVNWDIEGDDFVYIPSFSEDACYVENFVKDTLSQMSIDEREMFVSAMFNILYSTGFKSLKELTRKKIKLFRKYLKAPKEEKKIIKKILFKKVFKNRKIRRIILGSRKRN